MLHHASVFPFSITPVPLATSVLSAKELSVKDRFRQSFLYRVLLGTGMLVLLLGGLPGGGVAQAQSRSYGDAGDRYSRASVYRYAEPDEVTIRVSVWGAVAKTGIYEIPADARLNTLLSIAGGPRLGVREYADEKTIIMNLVRDTESGQQTVFEQTMEDELKVTEENPPLQDGDVLTVQSFLVEGVDWRDVLNIGSSVASLAVTIVTLISL
jgi:hypothetical protein